MQPEKFDDSDRELFASVNDNMTDKRQYRSESCKKERQAGGAYV